MRMNVPTQSNGFLSIVHITFRVVVLILFGLMIALLFSGSSSQTLRYSNQPRSANSDGLESLTLGPERDRPDSTIRATISFVRPLTAADLSAFLTEIVVRPQYLYFVEVEG